MSIRNLVDDYSRQYRWRSWSVVLDAMPNCDGKSVLDIGCGIGDLASDLSMRGARVIAVDGNQDFLQFARSRSIKNAEFRAADVRSFSEPNLRVDGIWSSFTAAYFPKLDQTLSAWGKCLRPGGWIVLTEIDDLFGHDPLLEQSRLLLDNYAKDSLSNCRYDFHMGRKIGHFLSRAGFVIEKSFSLPDLELCFTGIARSDVIEAWKARFEKMHLLRSFCNQEFEAVRDDFIDCLSRKDHHCSASVQCCIAIKGNESEN